MSEFHSKISAISQLRKQKGTCEDKLYAVKLELHRLNRLSSKQAAGQTVSSFTRNEQIRDLRQQIQHLEEEQLELNQALVHSREVLDKESRLGTSIKMLNKRIERLEYAAARGREQLAELEGDSETKPAALRKLSETIKNLNDSIKQDQACLEEFVNEESSSHSDFEEARKEETELRNKKNQIWESIHCVRAKLAEESQPHFHSNIESALETLKQRGKKYAQELKDSERRLETAVKDFYNDLHPEDLIRNLDGDIPFLLFPLRIETRFVENELWLRIFPDDIAVHTHEKTLTEQEFGSGKDYWRKLKAPVEDDVDEDELKKNAWLLLADLYGAFRASWIALQTKPENFEDATEQSQLSFAEPGVLKQNAWSSAPKSRVLPDRFVIYLHRGDRVIEKMTEYVPDVLHLGPDPLEAKAAFDTADPRKIRFSGPIEWMSDFDKALELGMGIKIPLDAADVEKGFDRIEVLGIYLTASEADSKEMLEDLIDNHHYGQEGFSLVPIGTPTNNTEENGSHYSDMGPDKEIAYLVEAEAPLFDPLRLGDEELDGHRLANALGIDYKPLQHVPYADNRDFGEAVDMNLALYPGTLGYYFENLMNPVFSDQALEEIRTFFTSRVTGRGPLPSIRVGDQPYGMLLTSDFSKWKISDNQSPSGRFLGKMYDLLIDIQGEWETAAKDVSYFGKPNREWDEVMMDVLGLHPGSVEFYQRVGYSTEYLKNLENFQWDGSFYSDQFKTFFRMFQNLKFFKEFGYRPDESKSWEEQAPQLLKLIYRGYHTLLDANNLIDENPLSEVNTIKEIGENGSNYIHWLQAQGSIEDLEKQYFGKGVAKPNSLLYLMIRQALLLQLHKASVSWMRQHKISVPSASAIKNFYNIRPDGDITKWEVMKADVHIANPDASPGECVADYILKGLFDHEQSEHLHHMRAALGRLADVPTARLERVFTEHIDVCTYRIDAWQTGMIYDRFWGKRKNNAEGRRTGIYLGAYGILEDVRLAQSRVELDEEDVPAAWRRQDESPVFRDEKNGGFVHAPSLQQASAAALLRSGYLNHANSETAELLSVNLSSRRVRNSLSLLDGLRAGMRLEVLLGYQFERALHERSSSSESINLDRYILDFREKFPIKQHIIPQKDASGESCEKKVVMRTVNGLELAAVTESFPFGIERLATASAMERQAIEEEKNRLADSLDALKDLLTSESVFQMVGGNFERASAVLNSLKDGQIPPELDVIKTPRSSRFTFTNRMTLHVEVLDPLESASNPWPMIPMTPRALMEPGLNYWLAQQIDPPDTVVYSVARIIQNETGEKRVEGEKKFPLSVLGLQPLDFIYIIGNELETGASELETRIAAHYRQEMGLEESAEVQIMFDTAKVSNNEKPLTMIIPLLRYLKDCIVNSRPCHAEDFMGNSKKDFVETGNPRGYNVTDCRSRFENILNHWESIESELGRIPLTASVNGARVDSYKSLHHTLLRGNLSLDQVPVELEDISVEPLRAALEKLSLFGHRDVYPSSMSGYTPEGKKALINQGIFSYGKALALRTACRKKLAAVLSEPNPSNQVNLLTELVQSLFGEDFRFLPSFYYHNGPDLLLSHDDENQLLSYAKSQGKFFPVEEWIQGASHVRSKILNLELIRSLVEVGQDNTLIFSPIQVPYRRKDSWLAMEFPETDEVTGESFHITQDTVSILIHGDSAFSIEKPQSGLVIDDWVEIIPSREELTGLTFNYNQPNSVPPQSLFLVIPPEERGYWKWDDLRGAMADTFKRAKERAVEPSMIDKSRLNMLLPALISEFTSHDLNISLDYGFNVVEMMEFLTNNMAINIADDKEDG